MNTPKSFRQFLNEFLTSRGFERQGSSNWCRVVGKGIIVVNLQKSAFGPGLYVNYGVSPLRPPRKRCPKTYDCAVHGRNPALSERRFIRFQALLDSIGNLLADAKSLKKVEEVLDVQIQSLESWCDRTALLKRLEHEETLDMLVNEKALR